MRQLAVSGGGGDGGARWRSHSGAPLARPIIPGWVGCRMGSANPAADLATAMRHCKMPARGGAHRVSDRVMRNCRTRRQTSLEAPSECSGLRSQTGVASAFAGFKTRSRTMYDGRTVPSARSARCPTLCSPSKARMTACVPTFSQLFAVPCLALGRHDRGGKAPSGSAGADPAAAAGPGPVFLVTRTRARSRRAGSAELLPGGLLGQVSPADCTAPPCLSWSPSPAVFHVSRSHV